MENAQAWSVKAQDVIQYDDSGKLVSVNLDIKNPNSLEAMEYKDPQELLASMAKKERKVTDLIGEIAHLLAQGSKQ